MSLPKVVSKDADLNSLQTLWAAQLDPVIKQPFTQGLLIKSVALASGANVVNHKLGRKLQGWVVTRYRGAAASIFDTQDVNPTPALTLTLNSSAAVTVDLYVF